MVMVCNYCRFEFTCSEAGPKGYPGTAEKEPIHCPNCGKLVALRRTGGWWVTSPTYNDLHPKKSD